MQALYGVNIPAPTVSEMNIRVFSIFWIPISVIVIFFVGIFAIIRRKKRI